MYFQAVRTKFSHRYEQLIMPEIFDINPIKLRKKQLKVCAGYWRAVSQS